MRRRYALHQLGASMPTADPPDVAQAEAYYQQALALAEELGMRPLQAHCHSGLGMLYSQDWPAGAGPRCAVHRHGDVSHHGDDLLAAASGGGAGAGGECAVTCAGLLEHAIARLQCHRRVV